MMFAHRTDLGMWRPRLAQRRQLSVASRLEDGVVDVVNLVSGAQAPTCFRASRAFKGPITWIRERSAFSTLPGGADDHHYAKEG